MKVLIGCETSGTVRDAFLNKGHDAWSCDILPSDNPSNRHIQDDVRYVLAQESWDMLMVAHPPCTRLCNSGVRWLTKAPPNRTLEEMWDELDKGCELFSHFLNADVPLRAIENPIMHKYAKERIENFTEPEQKIQPWQFAQSDESEDNVTKKTCFWLRGLPPLKLTGKVDGSTARDECHKTPPSKDRWKIRSKFFKGVADAMAEQWGNIKLNQYPQQISVRF